MESAIDSKFAALHARIIGTYGYTIVDVSATEDVDSRIKELLERFPKQPKIATLRAWINVIQYKKSSRCPYNRPDDLDTMERAPSWWCEGIDFIDPEIMDHTRKCDQYTYSTIMD
jgi:hypothetical protein